MSQRTWFEPRVAQLKVADVQSYLLQHGWTRQAYPGPELLVFGGPVDDDGEAILQVIPSDETMLDYPLRLEELLGALSVLEDRPVSEILTDMVKAVPANGAATPSPKADH